MRLTEVGVFSVPMGLGASLLRAGGSCDGARVVSACPFMIQNGPLLRVKPRPSVQERYTITPPIVVPVKPAWRRTDGQLPLC
jgi:hypothetical protein